MSAQLTVIVDGDTIMDGDLGQWSTTPPKLESLITEMKTNSAPALWMRCLMMVIAEVGMTAQVNPAPLTRVVTIETSEKVWSMKVRAS